MAMDPIVAEAVKEIFLKSVSTPLVFLEEADQMREMVLLLRIHETPMAFCRTCNLLLKHNPFVLDLFEMSVNPMKQKFGNA